MTRDMPAFPAAPYSAVTFPDDGYLVIPMSLVEGYVPPGAALLWLLLARLAEGHQAVEVTVEQLERHTGWSAAEIGEHARALSAGGWLSISKGRIPGSYAYRLHRMPSAAEVKEWAEDLQEPHQPTTTDPRPSQRPAAPKHHAAFWLGRVADPQPPQ